MNALGEPQRVVVFGGSSDIAAAIVQRLVSPGAHVCLVGPREETMAPVAADVAGRGVGVSIHVCDARNLDAHEVSVAEVFSEEVDVVIIAAGVLVGADSLADMDAAVSSLAVNGTGATAWMLRAHSRLQQQGHGCLVVLSSFAVARPRPSNWLYGAGKVMLDFAAQGLLQSGSDSVPVVLVRPGFVRSKMTRGRALAPFAVNPTDVARAVVPAVRARRSRVVWVPGVVRWAALVISLLPMSLVRRVDR